MENINECPRCQEMAGRIADLERQLNDAKKNSKRWWSLAEEWAEMYKELKGEVKMLRAYNGSRVKKRINCDHLKVVQG